jgi:hypothetical protein
MDRVRWRGAQHGFAFQSPCRRKRANHDR